MLPYSIHLSPSSRTSSPGLLSILRQSPSSECLYLHSEILLFRVLTPLLTRDVRSLSAGLNYPPSAPVQSSKNHPANKFADAFLTAQSVIAKRSRLNEAWKLMEFWEDRIIEPMAVIGKVLDPIIENALKKKGEKKAGAGGDSLEGETLLSHLVNLTDGKSRFHITHLL